MHTNRFQKKGFVVWTVCALFFLYEFFLRTVTGTYQVGMMLDLNLTSFEFSLISTTVFLFCYGSMQIPVGLILNRLGLKKALLIGAIACGGASIGFSYADGYVSLIGYRMLMGVGSSFGFVCLLFSVYDWMPQRYSAIFIGLSQFIGTLGPMIAAGPLESLLLSTDISWRFSFFCLGFIGFGIGLLIFLFVEENTHKAGQYTILTRQDKSLRSIVKAFAKIQPWLIAFLSAFLYFTVEYLSENEGRSFLMLKNISLESASYMITTSWIGYALGCPLVGLISDILQRRKIVVIVCAALGIAALASIVYTSNEHLLFFAFFLLGLSASGQSLCFALMAERVKKAFITIGFGITNGMITLLSSINAPLIGYWIDYQTKGAPPSIDTYFSVFILLIGLAVGAFVIAFFFIKETYCKSQVDFTHLLLNK
jgi:MFS family permease